MKSIMSVVRRGSHMGLLLCLLSLVPISFASAQAIEDKMVITHPPAGAVLERGSTIYFSPGSLDVYQWRITMGSSPAIAGLYDSGVRVFEEEPWEIVVDGIPSNGRPVTLRFWQRQREGDWISTDTVFNTRLVDGASGTASAPLLDQTDPSASAADNSQVNNALAGVATGLAAGAVVDGIADDSSSDQLTNALAGVAAGLAVGAVADSVSSGDSSDQLANAVAGVATGLAAGAVVDSVSDSSSSSDQVTNAVAGVATGLAAGAVVDSVSDSSGSSSDQVTNAVAAVATGLTAGAVVDSVSQSNDSLSDIVSSSPIGVVAGDAGSSADGANVSWSETALAGNDDIAVVTTVSPVKAIAPMEPTTNTGSSVSGLRAEHRDGQTFITWIEVQGDAGYHVYRHTSPITGSNITGAERLTGKWGPLNSDTSINKHAHGEVPATYVISDLGQPLSESNGLFVNTPVNGGAAYYAVTTVEGGRENISVKVGENSLVNAVQEAKGEPQPVLTLSLNRGKGQVYTQYMDYANWNPTFNGYAYNYTVTLPVGYRKSSAYPLLLRPHAYGEDFSVQEESEYGWQVIQIFPSDPGESRGSLNSWWFGYAADHNYQTDGPIPTSGSIANFTEERVMKAVRDTIDNPELNVDPQLVHAFGHSMGASGSLSLGIRYGNVFAGIYGSEGMTNYRTSPKFQSEFERLWGTQSSNLPIVNRGSYAKPIAKYQGVGVWDWMNHQKQLVDRRGDDMAYLMLAQGKEDKIIDWQTQGVPMARVFNEASIGYSSKYVAEAGHSWLGFAAIVHSLFGFGNDMEFPWRYPSNMSFPAIANASGSGSLSPGSSETDNYNLDIEWATPYTRFAKSIVDQPMRYEISLRSKSDPQTADITPRKTQQFAVLPGDQCGWVAIDSNKRAPVGSGVVVVDRDGLVTIPEVLITPYKGTRLAIECSST